MLSLSPRYDLFKFELPKDFIPEEVEDKYRKVLNRNAAVITNPIDYLNESIQAVTFPGISDLNIVQEQHGRNDGVRSLGRLNVEPKHDINYRSSSNPLENIAKEFKVTFRMNQGLYNYFILYESIFYKFLKTKNYISEPVFMVDILDESGRITSRIKLLDLLIDGIDGLDFSYSKIERDAGTFDITFKFNNIDFVFIDDEGKEI